MSDDPQDQAEALDESVVEPSSGVSDDDLTGDEFGEALPGYPPDRALGVNTVGVTAVEEDAGESFAERTEREVPELGEPVDPAFDECEPVGQLVDPYTMAEDHEPQAVADDVPAGPADDGPEAAALHVEEG